MGGGGGLNGRPSRFFRASVTRALRTRIFPRASSRRRLEARVREREREGQDAVVKREISCARERDITSDKRGMSSPLHGGGRARDGRSPADFSPFPRGTLFSAPLTTRALHENGGDDDDGGDIVPGGRVLRCIRRNYDDNLRETEGAQEFSRES